MFFIFLLGIIFIILGIPIDSTRISVKGGSINTDNFEISHDGHKFVKFSSFDEFSKLMMRQKVYIRDVNGTRTIDNAYIYADDTPILMTPFLRRWQKLDISRGNLFDIGAGTGKAYKIWKENHMKVWAVEPDPKNFEKLETLVGDTLQEVRCQSGSADVSKWIQKQSMNYVIMQSSITFFFENEQVMEKLIRNIKHCLKPGGTLIIIGMDGKKVQPGNNSVYNISVQKGNKTFGRKVTITIKNPYGLVHDQTEYMTDFDWLIERLKKESIMLEDSNYANPPTYLGPNASNFVRSQRYMRFKLI